MEETYLSTIRRMYVSKTETSQSRIKARKELSSVGDPVHPLVTHRKIDVMKPEEELNKDLALHLRHGIRLSSATEAGEINDKVKTAPTSEEEEGLHPGGIGTMKGTKAEVEMKPVKAMGTLNLPTTGLHATVHRLLHTSKSQDRILEISFRHHRHPPPGNTDKGEVWDRIVTSITRKDHKDRTKGLSFLVGLPNGREQRETEGISMKPSCVSHIMCGRQDGRST